MPGQEAGLVTRAEVPALEAALDRLLSDAALRAKLGGNAKRWVAKRFSMEAVGVAMKRSYEEILRRSTNLAPSVPSPGGSPGPPDKAQGSECLSDAAKLQG